MAETLKPWVHETGVAEISQPDQTVSGVVIERHFDFLLVGFAVIGASEFVVVFVLRFALFRTVQGEFATADEL